MQFQLYDDGYTRLGCIDAIDGLHDRLLFEYRLLPVLERERFRLALERSPDQEGRLTAAMMARQVRSWNVVDAHGQAAPINADSLLRLPAACFDRLYLIVVGAAPPDKRPGASPADEASDYLAELEAAAAGRLLGDVLQERDLKN